MGVIDFCLRKPVLVAVLVLFVLLSGIWALLSIPIQLTPDVELPTLTVRTVWPGASPYEVEREITREQEQHLNNLDNLKKVTSESISGQAEITLEFEIGTDLDDALLRATNQLNQVPSYPENADRPIVIASGANASPVVWTQVRPADGKIFDIRTKKRFAEDVIKPELEKIPGVSESRVYGGEDDEVQVRFDANKLTAHGISINDLIGVLRAENVDITGGTISQGKREYTIRTLSRFRSPEALANMIVKYTPTGPVYLRDLAEVGVGYHETRVKVLAKEGRSLIMPIYKEAGSNVLDITERVEATIQRLNRTVLAREGLSMRRLSDPSYYIHSAIDLVLNNLYLGGFMAIVVLYLFLGNFRSSLVVALTIPVSIIGTFVALKLLGRNINVISLAGLAFAVGMVVDAAIVVLENIDKWRLRGAGLLESCLKATQEVYGAILASALTTVAVFLPVVFVEDEAGQLFRDIAIAICVAILLSLLVSTTVIPPFYRFLFQRAESGGAQESGLHVAKPVQRLKAFAARSIPPLLGMVAWLQQRLWRKLALIGVTIAAAVLAAYYLAPKQEYLPSGNRNLILSFLFPPPGYSPDETEKVGEFLIADLRPYLTSEEKPDALMNRIFFIGFGTTLVFAAVAEDPTRVHEMIAPINASLAKVPGMRSFTTQASLFSNNLGSGRSIDVEYYGENVNQMAGIVAGQFMKARQAIPGAQIRPIPSFEIGTPEIQIRPFPDRAARAGLTVADLGLIVDIYTDGRKIGEFPMPNGDTLDLVLMADGTSLKRVDDFFSQALLAPNNQYVNLGAVADIQETVGPNQINHIGEDRAFTLRIMPPDEIPLQTALEMVQTKLVEPALSEYANIPGFRIELSGQADAFTKTRESLQTGFILALAITFLLLVILFEDMLAPFVIMGALPVAAAGGMILLWVINHVIAPTPLDVLTMLGFLMLIGIVVNNPILIVDRALHLMRAQNMPLEEAIVDAVQTRIRPIFMTTLTSVFGLLLSTFVSVVFVPTLFSLLQDVQRLFRAKATADEEDLLPKLARGAEGAARTGF